MSTRRAVPNLGPDCGMQRQVRAERAFPSTPYTWAAIRYWKAGHERVPSRTFGGRSSGYAAVVAATPHDPKPPSRQRSAVRGFITMLWRQAALAIPMAGFFGVIYAEGPRGFIRALQMSLVFSYVIGLLLWIMEQFV